MYFKNKLYLSHSYFLQPILKRRFFRNYLQTHLEILVSSGSIQQLLSTSMQSPDLYPNYLHLFAHDFHAIPVSALDHPEQRLQSS